MLCNAIGLDLLPVRYRSLKDFVEACGCSVEFEEPPVGHSIEWAKHRPNRVGFAPGVAQLLGGGRIVVVSKGLPKPKHWAHAAHEAAHYVAGPWSIGCEMAMLPWELSVVLSVADEDERDAAFKYMAGTCLGDYGAGPDGEFVAEDIADLVSQGPRAEILRLADGPEKLSPAAWVWREMVRECLYKGLPLDGSIPAKWGLD